MDDAIYGNPFKDPDIRLSELQNEVVCCRLCPRLVEWRERIAREKVRRFRHDTYWGRPVPAFGDPAAALVVIGLAPAAHGGNRTGRMFTGDGSGDWLFEALHACGFANQPTSRCRGDGLELKDCWVTAAVRCAPPANRPLPTELSLCSRFLSQELSLLAGATVFVALGRIAFSALLKAWPRAHSGLPCATPDFGHNRLFELAPHEWLISSYHPSQQNTLTGRLTRTMFHEVFRKARVLIEARP
ncbi:MAG: uracil-DNA glycosylase [Acidobacteria bacterium]|nr:uracil-DNA glycosylase [Acidobacteriota bacterium]